MTTVSIAKLTKELERAGLTVIDWRTKTREIGARHPNPSSRFSYPNTTVRRGQTVPAIGGTPVQVEDFVGGIVQHHGGVEDQEIQPLQNVMRGWFDYHVKSKQWFDVFYGVVVGRGEVCVGRGLRYSTGQNVATICVPGDYRNQDFDDEQRATILTVIDVYHKLGVPKTGDLWYRGHREVTDDSECPGDGGMRFVEAVRTGAIHDNPDDDEPFPHGAFELRDGTEFPRLREGSRGLPVQIVQGICHAYGLPHIVGPIDGIYGNRTVEAVTRLQTLLVRLGYDFVVINGRWNRRTMSAALDGNHMTGPFQQPAVGS